MGYNRIQTMRDNIEAIRTAFQLGVDRRLPTFEEWKVMSKYAGFGGLKCILNPADDIGDVAQWTKSDIELFAPTVELRRIIHEYSHDDREFARYTDSLKASVLTAFYTPEPIVDAISAALKSSGIEVRRFLEPSAGQGVFVDSFLRKDRFPGTEVVAYEKDLLTGKILSALHPSIQSHVEGFEKIGKDFNGYFDVAASNIPFGNFAVPDAVYATSKDLAYRQASKSIHNYFFLKALDSVREGGIVAFITSQGVMNAASPFVRRELVQRADLVAALRLPSNTFVESGTEAGSDLVILQKRSDKQSLSFDEGLFVQSVVDNRTGVTGNRFFEAFPHNVICTDAKLGTDQYGKPAIVYTHKDGTDGIARDLRTALDMSLRMRLDVDRYNGYSQNPGAHTTATAETPDTSEKDNIEVSKISVSQEVPLLKQYQEMKKKHPDAILIFRMGDFYEMFGEDAAAASEILKITLITRSDGRNGLIELAGFPHHALDAYLPKLVRDGRRVAICEQLEALRQKVAERVTDAENKDAAPRSDSNAVDETDSAPDYSGNPDPRLYAYNLFGELEPVVKPRYRNNPKADSTDAGTVPESRIGAKVPPISKFRQLTDKELEFYGSLNWEDNPPINRFYESMMSIAHRQLEERARLEAEKMAEEALKAAGISPGETYIEKTEGYFVPGRISRPSKVTAIPLEPKHGAAISPTDVPDMSPRPFPEDLQFFHKNGSMVVADGQIGFLSEVTRMGATFTPLALKPEQEKRAMLYVTLSETYQQLYHYEAEVQEQSVGLREHLNQYYDEFVEKYGHLNDKANAKMVMMDANGMDSLALEHGDGGLFVKADIFDHPVSFNINEVTSVDTPMEALSASLNKYGNVNVEYMSSLVDMDSDMLIENLRGHVYYNPLVSEYEIADRFIAGNGMAGINEATSMVSSYFDPGV